MVAVAAVASVGTQALVKLIASAYPALADGPLALICSGIAALPPLGLFLLGVFGTGDIVGPVEK